MVITNAKRREILAKLHRTQAATKAQTKKVAAVVQHVRKVLNAQNHDPKKQLDLNAVINRIVSLAQVVSEKRFYPYQSMISRRIVESVLIHDGEVITALISRQAGKTQTVGATVAALMIILPYLCRECPDSWHLNITDENGIYRGYRDGIEIGMYAPRKEQAKIAFDRVKECFERTATKEVLRELGITLDTFNGTTIKLSNGSLNKCESASEQSKIEGESYHLLILEEAQDISDLKIRKSLHPMVASTMGCIVKVGTAKSERCDFYEAIKTNIRAEHDGLAKRKNHFIFNYKVCEKYNSQYRRYIENEKRRIGEDSDEFKLSYGCVWIFERGMFVTHEQLFNVHIANVAIKPFNVWYPQGKLPAAFKHFSIVASIDWGSSADSTVLALHAVNWRAPEDTVEFKGQELTLYKKHLVCLKEWLGDDYETQYWELEKYLKTVPNLARVVMDSNACGKPMFDRFSANFLHTGIEIEAFNFSAQVKSDGYKAFYQDLSGHRYTFPASKEARSSMEYRKFVQQMLDLRKKYQQGRMVVAHPDDKHAHDDFPDAAMMGAHGCSRPAGLGQIEYSANNFFN